MPPKSTISILKKLRNVMKNSKFVCQTLQAYVIPSCDTHQSEYIAPCDGRIAYISGFTGSVGTAIVTEQHAAMWVDGRYFLQAEQEMDENWTLMKKDIPGTPTFSEWLGKVLPVGSMVGVDPYIMAYDDWRTLSKELKSKGHGLIAVDKNLIDLCWEDKPERTFNSVECHPIEYAGKTWQAKVIQLQKDMLEEGTSILVITALDEIAWLFNLRGSDMKYSPVFYAYTIVTSNSVFLCMDPEKLSSFAKLSLEDAGDLNVKVCPYDSVSEVLQMTLDDNKDESKVWISGKSSYALVSLIPKHLRFMKITSINLQKAIKNEQEINCARNAHIKDAAALCEFFCWLSSNVSSGNITEIDAAEKLEEFRKRQNEYAGISFSTISASGPNAAIPHYDPSKETNRTINPEEIYLCDCGVQFRDGGTTDVTRTLHFASPSAFEKECYTLVLKGHIALSSAVFPKFTTGIRLDSFARSALWEHGLDYLHGTGHGVGSYLNVHEGPMTISFRYSADDTGLQPGMILSIEPGCYIEGQFGIRLENLAVVREIETPHNFMKTGFLTFEPLTLVPFQVKMIDPSLLTPKEIKWLNDYHVTCRDIVGKVLEEEGRRDALQWLMKETEQLG